ncbi:MAG: hypothetical protein LWX54_06850 [Deltaproteobacteria bacterium]|jgi:hypothetical protein|nr:hypothetical protein [Deltaproteobacteria bacterium]
MKKNITHLFNSRRLGLERRRFSYSDCIPERRSIKDRRYNDHSKVIALKCMENHINVENPKAALAADLPL